ncbi:MAG TPA: hypothetical protein VJZ00_24690 [Thermoanaerobaculia bacterium]|nr:hypothetical protein [Thermoanaerobaculia bacterium]
MNIRRTLAAAAVLFAFGLSAQTKNSIEYMPVGCIRAGELPLLQLKVEGKGEVRAYFRKINTSDWCSVEGTNLGPLSRIVLPKFDAGDEIEYFFVLIEGRRVLARSPRIFRARVTTDCDLPWARHNYQLALSCGNDENGIPSSMGAGYSVSSRRDCVASPDSPDDIPCTSADEFQSQQ